MDRKAISLGPKSDLCYGRTGATKTSQVGRMAEYARDKYGLKTRLVSADPNGWSTIDVLVEEGIVEPFLLTNTRKFPLETITRLTQGWWPADPKDEHSKLLPPTDSANKHAEVAAYGFEGLSTLSTLIMSDLLQRQDIHIPETPKESFVKDDAMRWGFSGRAHYGFIQQRIYETVSTANHLPVAKVLWTAHETDAQDNSNRKIYGPAVIGQALTGQCGAWFGAMLHLFLTPREVEVDDPVNKGKKIKVVRRVPMMYLREHVDPDDPYRTPFLAKPRGPYQLWSEWADVMEPDIYQFYTKLDDMGARAIAAIREKAARQAATGVSK
jgi:hypothetical protein